MYPQNSIRSDSWNNDQEFQEFLRERELANRWKLSTRTLQRWRSEGYGPAYVVFGGAIRYRMQDILNYENRHRRNGRAGQ